MRARTLTTELWLPRPMDEVFAFFSDANNLNVLTPPWLHFHIVTPGAIDLRLGAILEYTIRWRGFPMSWRTEIAAWDPPHRFVDQQIAGPYRLWRHEHTFKPRDGETLVRDRVEYAVPGWILEPMVHALLVGPDVRRIFEYRQEKMRELLGKPRG